MILHGVKLNKSPVFKEKETLKFSGNLCPDELKIWPGNFFFQHLFKVVGRDDDKVIFFSRQPWKDLF